MDWELSDQWRHGEPNSAASVHIDLDRDQQEDLALLAVKTDARSEGLLVWLSRAGRWHVLYQGDSAAPLFMGLGSNGPGEFNVLCSVSEHCAGDGKIAVRIPVNSLSYYRPSSAGSIWYYSLEKGQFCQFWDSD